MTMNKYLTVSLVLLVAPIFLLLGGWIAGFSYGFTVSICAVCIAIAAPLFFIGLGRGAK